jgi:L-threonylcarbamoyladenylate synthase
MITKDLSIALKHLRQGDVIGMPTETVYGLAGNAFDANAIQKIYSIVHVGSIQQAETFVKEFPEPLRQLAQTFWPGPLTLLLKKSDRIPDVVTAGSDRVAIRIPNHPLTIELLNQLDFPLVAPSANPYTRISPTNAQQVDLYFGDQIPVVLDGGTCEKGLESTIVGWEDDQAVVYRLGALSIEQLESIVGNVRIRNQGEKVLLAPGMTKKHYSPSTPFLIVENVVDYQTQHPEKHIGVFLAGNEDPDEIAPGFYARLQEMDEMGFDVLIASRLSDQGLGRTINDRLKRAGH